MKNLTGKRALVCGASQGIGAATAVEFARAGAEVILLARSADKLEALAKDLPGGGHEILPLDLSRTSEIRTAAHGLLKKGPIEILVCNAGGPKAGPLAEATSEDLLEGFKIHVLGNQEFVRALVPGMRERNYGRIINVISTSVKIPLPNLGVSNTIRGAVASWAKTLASELGPFGITVNNVLPGYTRTQRLESLLKTTAEKTGQPLAVVEEAWRKSVPAGRFAEPEETAHAIAFLASPLAAYINGINLPVDGGRTGTL